MRAVFYVGVSRRGALGIVLIVVALAVVARCAAFMMPGVRFDADQAVVGLMAKHISEGRAFPVYFYGQSYLLALEAYLAAPVMWLLGPTEIALKLPALMVNVMAALLVVVLAHRDLGLRPWLAAICALPLILPPIVPASRLVDAGGHSWPLFYALLLWILRRRPWLFGATMAVALAHRELTVLAAGALFVLDVLHGGWRATAVRTRWIVAAVLVIAGRATIDAVSPFGAMFGPGSTARAGDFELSSQEAIGAQICLDPSRWPARVAELVTSHLPTMAGGHPRPLADATVNSGIGAGNPGLAIWVLTLVVVAGLAGWHAARRAPAAPNAAEAGAPDAALPWFLGLTALSSIVVYGLVACSAIALDTLRYDLLALLLPVGVLMAGLRTPVVWLRAGLVTATVLWTAVDADDYRALAAEVYGGRWPDHRGNGTARLEARQIGVLWGDVAVIAEDSLARQLLTLTAKMGAQPFELLLDALGLRLPLRRHSDIGRYRLHRSPPALAGRRCLVLGTRVGRPLGPSSGPASRPDPTGARRPRPAASGGGPAIAVSWAPPRSPSASGTALRRPRS